MQAMVTAAPTEALSALEGPIRTALANRQDADKPRTWAAVEAMAGLLASGVLFNTAQGEHPCLVLWRISSLVRPCRGLDT